VCRAYLGGLLTIASILKANLLLTDPPGPSLWFQVMLAEIELALGLAFLLRVHPRLLRWVCIFLFSGFMVISVSEALSGEQTCGCFGRLAVTPLAAALIDLSALLFLWRWRPAAGTTRISGVVLCLAPAIVLLCAFVHVSTSPAFAQLLACAKVLDLGELEQGTTLDFRYRVENLQREPIVVELLETSCSCLSASLPCEVAPHSEVGIPLTLDLGKEPEYFGRLSIRCTGRTRSGKIAFTGLIKVAVLASS
jgi:hypothetical protein